MAVRVVVVGQGVIGLASARALAEGGARVTVVEGSARSREASWAAAGLLGAGSEADGEGPWFRFLWDAMRGWPATIADLRAETGVDVAHDDRGTVHVAFDDAEAHALEARLSFLSAAGFPAEGLDAARALKREPTLGAGVARALWVGDPRLDARRLWDAYEASCRARGVETLPGRAVEALVTDGDRVRGVVAGGEEVRADVVVLAAGAWTEGLAALAGLHLPVVPVKGQMACVPAVPGTPSHAVFHGSWYAVPLRGRGTVLGTTSEEGVFERAVSPAVVARIRAEVGRFLPALARPEPFETWSGLRPRLPDLRPAIGPVPGRPGLVVATGHYRNGILLAEATGRLVAGAVLGGGAAIPRAFAPGRFRALEAPRPATVARRR
jgi:glycine oxidase